MRPDTASQFETIMMSHHRAAFEVAIPLGRGLPLGKQKRSLPEIGAGLRAGCLFGRAEIAFAQPLDLTLEAVLTHMRDECLVSRVVVPVIAPVIAPFDWNPRGRLCRWLSRSGEEVTACVPLGRAGG
jgi:hypothetical protein